MFGWLKHKHDKPSHEQAEPAHENETDAGEHTRPGPIPGVSHEETAAALGHDSASEQAYDKKGKDPKYKTKEWANRGYDQLDASQKALIDSVATDGEGGELWNALAVELRAGFLNITAVMRGNGFDLGGLSLLPLAKGPLSGIQQDRLMFTAESAAKLKGPLEEKILNKESLGDRGFMKDKPEEKLHPGMAEWGGRQWVTQWSMQVGGGSAGAFVDIDEFGPKVDVVGTFGHLFEVLHNSTTHDKTDPFKVARGLDKRGDDP